MPDLLFSTLSKVLLPAAAIGVMLVAARKKGKLSFSEDLGLKAPKPVTAVVFLVLWVCLIALEEFLTSAVEGTQAKPWPADYPAYIVAMRILAIGILGPIAEELAFRGVLFSLLLRKTRLGVIGTIVLTAALWSVIHLQYAPTLLLLIFVDGLVLGFARHRSGSLYLPIAMHVMGNLFSIYQSLAH